MSRGEANSYPIRLLVNYWEMRTSTGAHTGNAALSARLDELIRQGVNQIATFVPWQAVESDISHTLTRFLQAAAERKMSVSLILTPEVGVNYPNSGLPKDVISRQDNQAEHAYGGNVAVPLPPNAFSLPSLTAPEFTKRYSSFLSRMDSLLADLGKAPGNLLAGVDIVLTGSFWKYYRSPQASAKSAFGGMGGDFSSSASLAYRQRVDQFYAQREFSESGSIAANRWKTRPMEEVNRRWFSQQCEDVFRNRTFQMVRRKAVSIRARELELFTPEADPGIAYSQFLMSLTGGHGDFARLSSLVDEAASRATHASSGQAESFIHWSSLGSFRSLADSEKQFLILKSLLLMGGRGGGILIDESEWFALSHSFRARAENLARSIANGDLRLRNRAVYLAPHVWSSTGGAGTLWEEMFARVGSGARLIASLDLLVAEADATLAVIDPSLVITRETIQKLVAWTRGGRVVVLPRSPLMTETARVELEQVTAQTRHLEIDLGIPYRLHSLGDGKLIIYDMPEISQAPRAGESLSSWQTFLTAVLSVAEVQGYCRMSDSRLSAIPLEKRGEGLGLFVLNSTRRQVAADIIFPGSVTVSDLAVALAQAGNARSQHGTGATASTHPQRPAAQQPPAPAAVPANRFSLEVPPCGILPLAVDGLSFTEQKDRQAAVFTAGSTSESAFYAATTELPGYSSGENIEDLWN